jgi:hypothetical protein
MICHPDCLSDSLIGMPRIVRRILNSTDKHEEILAWQDRVLREDFVQRPIAIFEKAIDWKVGNRISTEALAGQPADRWNTT